MIKMSMPTPINQKEYLKKYLSGNKSSKEKRKKKKSKKAITKGFKIVDDSVDFSEIPFGDCEEDEAPTIADITYESENLKRLDEFKVIKNRWRNIGSSSNENADISQRSSVIFPIKLEDDLLPTKKSSHNSKQITHSSHGSKDNSRHISLEYFGNSGKRFEKGRDKREKDKSIKSESKYDSSNLSSRTEKSIKSSEHSSSISQYDKLNESNANKKSTYQGRDQYDLDHSRSSKYDSEMSSKQWKNERNKSPFRRTRNDSDVSPPRGTRRISDTSPPRRKKINSGASTPRRTRHNSDASPPRRTRHDSNASPPRRKRHDSDASPPRRMRHDSDASPPRRTRHDSDASPPRRTRHDSDASPPRRTRHDSDASPTRRTRHDSDASPPRRTRHDSDASPPRRTRRDSDASPPRKTRHDSDASPSRRTRHDSDASPPRRAQEDSNSPSSHEKTSNSNTNEETRSEKSMTTAQYLKARKQGKLKKDDPEELMRKERESVLQKKAEEKYKFWNKGVVQTERMKEKVADTLYEMTKSFARSADDINMNEQLKSVVRQEDPMMNYVMEKKTKTGSASEMPIYRGPFPPNRFNIRPGYRWDGVDRSNGYESDWFQHQNTSKAVEEEKYKWSVEDM